MRRRFPIAVLLLLLAAPPPAGAQDTSPADIPTLLKDLAAFDYPTRMRAARLVRRLPPAAAIPALSDAARGHEDQFVRYRALVLLTGFNAPGAGALMRELLVDRNDRVREVVYRWYERNPSTELAPLLLAALNIEQSEFVRPALIHAAAALPSNDRVERALVAEIGRGFDFFRSAVIDALGRHRAAYALDALAPLTASDGALQDDAILAIGRIGESRGLSVLAGVEVTPAVEPALQAAQCMLGDRCAERIAWLAGSASDTRTRVDAGRAAINALAALAERNTDARDALLDLEASAPAALRRDVAVALSAVALRDAPDTIAWLASAASGVHARVLDLFREGFERLEEDFAEEQFFTAARAAYWQAPEESPARTAIAATIDALQF